MSDHLPECPLLQPCDDEVPEHGYCSMQRGVFCIHCHQWCICDRLRMLEARILSKLEVQQDCWLWVGVIDRYGVYEALVGPIPDGMELDHLCKARNCVRGLPAPRREPRGLHRPDGGKRMRRRIANGEEQDAYTKWRQLLVYMGRPGVVKSIKRRTHKRERREGQQEINDQLRSDQ